MAAGGLLLLEMAAFDSVMIRVIFVFSVLFVASFIAYDQYWQPSITAATNLQLINIKNEDAVPVENASTESDYNAKLNSRPNPRIISTVEILNHDISLLQSKIQVEPNNPGYQSMHLVLLRKKKQYVDHLRYRSPKTSPL